MKLNGKHYIFYTDQLSYQYYKVPIANTRCFLYNISIMNDFLQRKQST